MCLLVCICHSLQLHPSVGTTHPFQQWLDPCWDAGEIKVNQVFVVRNQALSEAFLEIIK